jgi:hypothetical protein
MRTSETIKGLSEALAKAQANITNPPKDGKGNYGKYATLESGLIVIREHLSACGISFCQSTRIEGDIIILQTRLSHGNEWVESEYPVCKFPLPPQQIGSAMTYSRRYSLFALVGVSGDEDDDGTEANKSQIHTPKKASSGAEEQSKEILEVLLAAMEGATSPEEVDKWVSDNMKTINKLFPAHKDELREEVKILKHDLAKTIERETV